MRDFHTAAVIGTGMMGPGIAVTLASGGVETTIVSRTEEGAARGLAKAREQVAFLERHGVMDPAEAARAAERLHASAQLERAVRGADLVIESTPEEMTSKQVLFATLEELASEAVLASNTSSLSITALASKCRRRDRVLTTHFWNPPHLMPLVEIVCGRETSREVAAAVRCLLLQCGKTPVMVKQDRPGQLGNRLQMALWREAVHIVAEGIADPEDVDLAAKTGFGLRLPVYGIFEHADGVGLDLVHAVMDYTARDLYNQPQAPPLLKQKVEAGQLGVKTGCGFYDWSEKSFADVAARRDQFLVEFLRSRRRRGGDGS
ncbi:MAG: 3-hydroxyacyl-CoA dehydrogenase family protein [Bryobacteraceae bacterium]|nr:3-hydroxyacyl-CoA dehydrogenase family protein [Bryobacteraceae bacterium]